MEHEFSGQHFDVIKGEKTTIIEDLNTHVSQGDTRYHQYSRYHYQDIHILDKLEYIIKNLRLMICTNVARAYVAWMNVTITDGIY